MVKLEKKTPVTPAIALGGMWAAEAELFFTNKMKYLKSRNVDVMLREKTTRH